MNLPHGPFGAHYEVLDEDAGSLVTSPPGSSGSMSSSSEAEPLVLCLGEVKLNCKNYTCSLNKHSISKITSNTNTFILTAWINT